MWTFTRGSSPRDGYSSLVPSVLPSSTTTSSISHGKSTLRTSLIAEARVARSLYTGMRIDSFTVGSLRGNAGLRGQGPGKPDRLRAHRFVVPVFAVPAAAGCGKEAG